MKKNPLKRKILSLYAITSLTLLPFYTPAQAANGIQASQVASQPNLMILLSNSASMSLNMDGTSYASASNGDSIQDQCLSDYSSTSNVVTAPTFNDANTGACGGQGTYFQYGMYGNQSDSRFYIAKQTLYNLLSQGYANSINLGFATYRQAMGMELAAVSYASNAIYPYIYLNNQQPGYQSTLPSPYNTYTPTQLSTLGNNPLNFSFVDWFPVYNSQFNNTDGSGNDDAFIGNYSGDPWNANPLFATTVSYLNGINGGGLPYSVSYPQGTLQNYEVPSGTYQYSYYGAAGLTQQQQASNTPEPVLDLCQTYYNSQQNDFQAIYTDNASNGTPQPFQQTFPDTYVGNTPYYVTLGSDQFNNGYIGSSYTQSCNVANTPSGATAPSSESISSGYNLVTNQFSNGSPSYFDYIPNYLSGTVQDGGSGNTLNLNPGQADGWSGATTVSSNGTVTAQYPSTPQPESILGSWDESGAKWMGVFVNLPSTKNPTNNTSTIENLIDPNYPMENPSGLEYHYSTQTLESSSGSPRSIVNSTEDPSYNGHQEPLNDALGDAIAYWKAFESADPTAQCQPNNMLVIYDGISDGDTNLSASQEEQELIQKAQTLYNTYGVKVFVVIISSNQGDIEEANKLAAAGGTQSAYQVSNSSQLYNDLKTVLINVASESINARLGAEPTTSAGSYDFAPVNVSKDTGQGDLVAYEVLSSGGLNTPTSLTPSFDANTLMQNRDGSNLYSTNYSQPLSTTDSFSSSGAESTLTNLANNDPNDFGAGTNPSPSTIADYTINPSYDSGAYLGGRQSGWYMGLPTSSAPVVVTPPDNGILLSYNNGYSAFAQAHENRQNAVLFTSNDGFLYALGYTNSTTNPNPSILWGWMPQGLLQSLSNYNSFWQSGSMQGGITETDAANNGTWHSYAVGSALNGGILYSLQLTGASQLGLGNTVVEYDLNTSGSTFTQPLDQAPAIYNDPLSGDTLAAWSENVTSATGSTSSEVLLMNVATGQLYIMPVSGTLTSMPIFDSNGDLFVAAGSTVYEDSNTQLMSEVNKKTTGVANSLTNATTINNAFSSQFTLSTPSGANPSTQIEYLQSATVNGTSWMTVESSNGIWAYNDNSSWAPQWFSGIGDSAVYTSSGWSTPSSSNAIVQIPSGGYVSNPALIVNNSVILPVSVQSTSGNTCSLPTAYYNLYKLSNGANPNSLFTNINGNSIQSASILIGYGTSFTPTVSIMNGKVLVQSSASNTDSSNTFLAATSSGLLVGGPIQSALTYYGQLKP